MEGCGYEPFQGYPLSPTLLSIARKTYGLQNFYHTTERVLEMFGVDVRRYPTLFTFTKTGLVVKSPKHEEMVENYIIWHQNNMNALGVISE